MMLKILSMTMLCFSALPVMANDTTVVLKSGDHPVPVRIISKSDKSSGTILLLHGWNLPPAQWCEKTELCSLALANKFTLIIPDFGKTTYHYETYPETIEKYRIWPTRRWMYDHFLVYMQDNFSLLKKGDNNFVAGLSTGGRGAAFFALEHPEIFKAAACLSADFDQTKITDEPINNGYYGSYKLFPERWEGRDNIHIRADELKIPLLLAHGTKDKICPWTQTQNFYEKINGLQPAIRHLLIIDVNAEHDYKFWGGISEDIIEFFKNNLN